MTRGMAAMLPHDVDEAIAKLARHRRLEAVTG